ncbi:MAG: hypothetical protein WC477_07155 [Patescibacteria group bacterium]
MNRIRLLSTVGVIAGLLAVFSMLLFAQDSITDHPVRMPTDWDKAYPQYAKGANDALDAIILLHLEQRLQGTNRTWGAMAEIVCERMNIERRK